MKRGTLTLLCILLFLLITLGGLGWLFLSSDGVFSRARADEAMDALLSAGAAADWQERFYPVWEQQTGPWEDRRALFDAAWESAVAGGDIRFSRQSISRGEAVYLLSAGENALGLAYLTYIDGAWQYARAAMPTELFSVAARTLSVTVPEGSQVFLNGVEADGQYITEDFLPYEDMSPLERRFAAVPHEVRYEIPGFCAACEVSALREGEALPLLYADGTDWRFTVPDAAAYSFRILAPAAAEVSVSGALLGEDDRSDLVPLPLDVDVPEDRADRIPLFALYEADGLYTEPVVTAALDGETLTGELTDGTLLFPLPGARVPESVAETVTAFLRSYCLYGAHNFGYGGVIPYVVPESELYRFLVNAQPSLVWILGESVEFHAIDALSYIPLGDDAGICTAHVSCTTRTAYETQELEMDYQLLCVELDGSWLIQDMAYE